MKPAWRSLDGVLLFDKPLHLSSNTALQKVRRLFQAQKAGHTGTLDPLASGLLPICFGEATKFSNMLLDASKTYRAWIRLGIVTSTGDAEGVVVSESTVNVEEAQLRQAMLALTGEIEQVPPMHSALKHQGRPLYEYIRKGETVEREARRVVIHEMTLEGFSANEVCLKVHCSKGTYVRTLAEDLGRLLGCGAHLAGLRRLAIAHLDLEGSYSLEKLESLTMPDREGCISPIESLMPGIPELLLDEVLTRRLSQGQRVVLEQPGSDGLTRLHGPDGFIGLGRVQGRLVQPERMISSFAHAASQRGAQARSLE